MNPAFITSPKTYSAKHSASREVEGTASREESRHSKEESSYPDESWSLLHMREGVDSCSTA